MLTVVRQDKDIQTGNTRKAVELVDAIWNTIPDFHESYELPDGLYRQHLPAYDKRVVRELLVNALVHRPYTQRGDIFLNLHPDRFEIVNPGPGEARCVGYVVPSWLTR